MSVSSPHSARLLEARQYCADLTHMVAQAQRHIAISSLVLTDDVATHKLIEALVAAAERGIVVELVADSFTFSELGGYFNPFKRWTRGSLRAKQTARRLQAAGARFTWLDDRHKLNPFAGVTHSKWSIVDDTCYVFGGVNLYENGIDKSVDYMFRIDDANLASRLTKQQHAIVASPSPLYTGYTALFGDGTWYIDSGQRDDSLIYSRACALADEATRVLFVSQYSPSGPLATLLRATDAECYFNQPHDTSFPTSLMLWHDRLRTGIVSRYRHKKYLHAKFIIFTMPDGKKIALTGSHNFSHKGVVFGTREIALETSDSAIIAQLEAFCEEYIR
jgi:cardiolipin synthase